MLFLRLRVESAGDAIFRPRETRRYGMNFDGRLRSFRQRVEARVLDIAQQIRDG